MCVDEWVRNMVKCKQRAWHTLTAASATMGRSVFLSGIILIFCACVIAPASATDDIELGRRIYLDGILPSGALLKGKRSGGESVSGADAACSSCHRKSGMGSVEGTLLTPPITGKFLFGDDKNNLATLDQRRRKSFNQRHEPYTDELLARAVHNGVNNAGRELSVVMPRFDLSDVEMKALTAYLKQLSVEWSPGVTAQTIRFATVITPDVEPARRQVMLDTMRAAFIQKNASTVAGMRRGGRRHMVSAAEMVLGTERTWELDVWELNGSPDTWGAQLAEHYRKQPVFALISGLSNTTWEPVHDFCQHVQVPCWFPSVALPVNAEAFYPVYFSRGVMLEADVLARHLLDKGERRPQRLIMIFRDDYPGRNAAKALTRALAGSGIEVEERVLRGTGEEALRSTLSDVQGTDSLMFWLRAPDVAALDRVAPTAASASYFSAALAGAENAPVPPAWKRRARMIYPYELPDRRQPAMANFHTWCNLHKLALVDEAMQSEIYFSVTFLSDTLAEMLDNVYRDYLLERAENMLSQREGSQAEEQTRQRISLGRVGDLARRYPTRKTMAETRGLVAMDRGIPGRAGGTTIYPRLSLARGQRFASKGGYIVRFDGAGGDKLVAESGWIVP